jgi:hypothetical protein
MNLVPTRLRLRTSLYSKYLQLLVHEYELLLLCERRAILATLLFARLQHLCTNVRYQLRGGTASALLLSRVVNAAQLSRALEVSCTVQLHPSDT